MNSAQKIDKSIQKMMTLGRRLGILFTALFIAVCCCSVVVVISIGLMAAQGNLYDPSKTVSVVVPLMYLLISGGATWTLRGISMDTAHGESPFTLSHARRISIIGWLFVAAAIGDLLFSPGFLSIVIGPFDLLGNAYSMFENLALPIDIGAVLGAVCCFSISAIWRYGASASRPDRGFGVRGGMDYLIIELESLLLRRGKTSTDIIRATGHTPASISKIRNGKVKAIRLKTLLDICVELDCQPGDLIKRVNERELEELATRRARNALSRATATGDDPVLESDHVYVVDLRDD